MADDDYTATYMEGGRARFVAKQRMPAWFFALMAVSVVATAGSGFAHGSVVGVLGVLPLMLVTLLLSHLRVTVTDDAVHVQYGLWGPSLALDAIRRCEPGRYDALRFGGWGFRRAFDGSRAYSVPGGSGECVTLEVEEDGARRTVVLTAPDGAALARSIEEARARRRSSGVRVGVEEPVEAAPSVPAEAADAPGRSTQER